MDTSMAPWRQMLARALHRNRSLANARYLQLATINADLRPANRTVVFRGFLEPRNQLKFITDVRSPKIEQIKYSPWTEACWYFPKTREQFRIAGQLALIDQDCSDQHMQQQRQLTWQALSEAAREQFMWPAPGTPKVSDFQSHMSDVMEPESPFCLLLLQPHQVDHLELRGMPHQQRCIYTRDSLESWSIQPVNP